MDVRRERAEAVENTIADIKAILSESPTRERLTRAKNRMVELANRSELFPRDDYPLPDDGRVERTYRLRQDTDGRFALYINSALPGQDYRPHDHGGAWAIVVAVSGQECHRLYHRMDDGSQRDMGRIEIVDEIEVRPGLGVAMLPDDIHSIHALDPEPLLHLHLYGVAFEYQAARKEYNLEDETYVLNNNIGITEEAPLVPVD